MVAPRMVSVIVPVHNAEHTILEQLNAIAAQEVDGPWEVVVVLNRCTDDTERVVREWSATAGVESRVVVADEGAGATFARNHGAAAAAGDTLLFCDADDVIQAGWVAHMAEALGSADVVGGRFIAHPTNSPRVRKTFPLELALQRDGLPQVFGRVHFVASGSLGCRRDAFDAVGGFSADFPHGSEDIVFSIQAQRLGFRLGFAPGAECAYRWRSTVRDVIRQRSQYQRSHAQVIATFAPEEDAGFLSDMLHLAVSAARAAVPVPPGLARRRLALLRIQAARVRAAARLRRRADLRRLPAGGEQGQHPLVDVTIPLDWQLIGGLGFVAPLSAAREMPTRHDLRELAKVLAERSGVVHNAVVIGAGAGALAVAAGRLTDPDGVVVVHRYHDMMSPALHLNLKRHAVTYRMGPESGTSLGGHLPFDVVICDLSESREANLAVLLRTLKDNPQALVFVSTTNAHLHSESGAALIERLRARGELTQHAVHPDAERPSVVLSSCP